MFALYSLGFGNKVVKKLKDINTLTQKRRKTEYNLCLVQISKTKFSIDEKE